MGNCKSTKSKQKINLNNEKYYNQKNTNIENESQYEKEVINEIIIELKISDEEIEKEINILCDKNKLIEDYKKYEDFYRKKILILQKNLIILIKIILNYI